VMSMSLPITLYGAVDCDDTERLRAHLKNAAIPFREVMIDHDVEAEHFVIFINDGFRSTPTVVMGEGKQKIILTEPTPTQFDHVWNQAQQLING
jgi:mycoredoxin